MRSIFDIDHDITACVMYDEDGNDAGTDYDRLEHLQMERESKLESVAAWYKCVKAEHDAVKAEKLALDKRQKALASRMDGIKAYLQHHLDGECITSGRVKVSYRVTHNCVDIIDEMQIPVECMRVTYEPNKTAIKNILMSGDAVAGAELSDHISLIIK